MTTPDQPSRLTRYTRRVARILVGVLAVLGALAILGAKYDTTPTVPTQAGITNPTEQCPNGWRTDGHTIRCLAADAYSALPRVDVPAIEEDEPGWDCRTMGNHICSPTDTVPAGCYSGGQLVIPWTRYDRPTSDPLYAQDKSVCGTQEPADGEAGGSVLTEDGTSVPPAFYAQADSGSGSVTGSVMAEAGSLVPASFYDRTDYTPAPKAAAAPARKAGSVVAEDGSRVPSSFYSATDYDRDGLVDQTGKPIGS